MKYIFYTTFLFSLLLNQKTVAQDIIKFKNGVDLNAKVQEITPQEIKYKRFDNLDGPLITVLKNTVNSIQYENGTIETMPEVAPTSINMLYSNLNGFSVGDIVTTDFYNKIYQGKIVESNTLKNQFVVELTRNGKTKRVNRRAEVLTLVKPIAPSVEFVSPTASRNSYNQSLGQSNNELFIQGQRDATKYYHAYSGAATGTFFGGLLAGPIIGLIPAAACSSTPPSQDRLGIPNAQYAQDRNYLIGYTQEAHRIKKRKVWSNYGIGAGITFVAGIILASRFR